LATVWAKFLKIWQFFSQISGHSASNITGLVFLVKRVPDGGPEQRESIKTVLYLLIIINILICYIIIKLLIKMRTFTAKTGNSNWTVYFTFVRENVIL
jgi:hypothetical protein